MIDSVKAYCTERKRPLPFFNIEIKSLPEGDNTYHPEPPQFVELLMKVIRQNGILDKVIIQSFDFRSLQYLHQHYPQMIIAALIEDYDKLAFDKQVEKLGFTPNIYSPAFELVTPELVQQCLAKGVKLVPWTVNDPKDALRLKEMGVDGLITDYPDRIRF